MPRSHGSSPAVLVITYFVLLRAFRSMVLPLKAVPAQSPLASAPPTACSCSSSRTARHSLGFTKFPQIEAWIPIFLFAIVFGISMDYEVFMLSRDARGLGPHATTTNTPSRYGLEHTGRIITAAAIIMIAAFSGFMTGRFVGLQEFGLGLSAAIFLDATVVRVLLVPSLMKLLGDWNWYLPERVRRVMRLRRPRAAPVPTS